MMEGKPDGKTRQAEEPAQAAQGRMQALGSELQRQIAELGPWFHNLHLPDGTQTAPDHHFGDFPSYKWQQIAPHIPSDLRGWRVLDIGCNAGYYTFQLAQRGAQVVGIDVDERYLKQARWAARQFQLADRVELRQMQIYELAATAEEFDLVMFMGVLYHLRYPMLALDIVCRKVRRMMVFQTLTMPGMEVLPRRENITIMQRDLMRQNGWPKMAFIENRLDNDPTNWWAPNHSCIEAMLRSAGMEISAYPGHEIYLCRPAETKASSWDESEYLAATGGIRKL